MRDLSAPHGARRMAPRSPGPAAWLAAAWLCVTAALHVPATRAQTATAAISSDIGYPTVADALAALRGSDKIIHFEIGEWAVFVDQSSGTFWQLTLPGHQAHPSAIRTTASCEIHVRCEADRSACARLLAAVQRGAGTALVRCPRLPEFRTAEEASVPEAAPVKAVAVVTVDGPAGRCQVRVAGDATPQAMSCPDVVLYLRQTRKLAPGAYVDWETVPDVDDTELEQVQSALREAGYRPTPGPHVGFLTEPPH